MIFPQCFGFHTSSEERPAIPHTPSTDKNLGDKPKDTCNPECLSKAVSANRPAKERTQAKQATYAMPRFEMVSVT